MEFGKVESDELDFIEATLPPDRPETARVLSTAKKGSTRFYIGCAKWGRKDWVGKIYPPKTKEADFLNHYAKHFNSIELNATFYRMPRAALTSGWKSKVGPDFRFCPKFVNSITHIKRLKDTSEAVGRFLNGVSGFGENLGPILLMPHPGFGPKNMAVLDEFLTQLPEDLELVAELRHPDWYSDPSVFREVFDLLERHSVGAAITDALGRRDCVHMRLTVPEAFIRFVGNNLHPSDYKRVDLWVSRIKNWMENGIQKVYFFMHQSEEVNSPELAKYVIQQLNQVCGTQLPEPAFQKSESEPSEEKKPVAKRGLRPKKAKG
jgi:uncharacterized protein YecE (DUF72 family)